MVKAATVMMTATSAHRRSLAWRRLDCNGGFFYSKA